MVGLVQELQKLSWQQEGTVVSVLQGTVDRLHVELPWSKESQGSVRAHVSGVDVMIKVVFDRSFAPTSHAKHTPDADDVSPHLFRPPPFFFFWAGYVFHFLC